MARRRETLTAVDPGPSIRATSFSKNAPAGTTSVLSDRQREQINSIATRIRLPARTVLYREGASAEWLFIAGAGVAKAFRELPSGRRRIVNFIFPHDLIGLAEAGRYVNTLQAITALTLYKVPLEDLHELLKQDTQLEYSFLLKLTHELRAAQRQAIVLGRRDAPGRLAMFLSMLERNEPNRPHISMPMSRADIADYLGLSQEAVSRAAKRLGDQGVLAFDDRHTARVLDRGKFEKIVAAL